VTLARAALAGAGLNVRINLKSLKDLHTAKMMSDEIESLEQRAAQLEVQAQEGLKERGGLTLA
jgi:formiminotetrahydrofolate cyclodeaminase